MNIPNIAKTQVNNGLLQENPAPSVLNSGDAISVGEPTISLIARGVDTNTGIQQNDNNLITAQTVTGSWTEPASEFNAKYPFNNVKQTESGHFFEMDDTPSSERVRLQHRTGSFFQIYPNGEKVTKVVSDNYEIILGNGYVYIKGTCDVTVEGTINIYSPSQVTLKTPQLNLDGNLNVQGTITSTGDVIAAGISLDNHVHGGVQGGTSQTSPPV